MKARTATLFIFIIALVVSITGRALTQPVAYVKVSVFDQDGKPLPSSYVIFYNWFDPSKKPLVFKTDEGGRVEAQIEPAPYLVYIFHETERRVDYIPVKLNIVRFNRFERLSLEVRLRRAAVVPVKGNILFIGGRWLGVFRIEIFDREGNPLSRVVSAGSYAVEAEGQIFRGNITFLGSYGSDTAYDRIVILKATGIDIGKRTAYAPARMPIRIRVLYKIYDERTRKIETYTIFRGTFENPLVLEPGEVTYAVDLTEASIKSLFSKLKSDVGYARNLINEFERLGFYLTDEIDMVASAESLLKEAERLHSQGGDINRVLANLERVYVITRVVLPRRLGFTRTVSMEGAVILPTFLAVFAAVLSNYIHEARKKKVIAFVLFYALLVTLFSFVYPGFAVLWSLDRVLFAATVTASFIVLGGLLFMLPVIIKEPFLPGEIDVPGLISITFSLAKRYSKVRKFRTAITVFSLTALIWAFTVLASFSQVYTKIHEANFAEYPRDVIVVRRVVNGTLQPLNYELDSMLLREGGASQISPRVLNNPGVNIILTAKYGSREYVMHSLMGVSEHECNYTDACVSVIGGERLGSEDTIFLPSSARMLGAKVGDEILLLLDVEGVVQLKFTARLGGYFSEERLMATRDPDGFPIIPFVVQDNRMIYVNGTDLAVMNSRQLIDLIYGAGGRASAAFSVYSIAADPPQDRSKLRSLAEDIVDRRGGEYVVVGCSEGVCDRVRYGSRMESVFERDIAFIVPIAIVALNVLITMYSIVRERRREIFIFTTVGFNPTYIALVFMAEAIIYGLLSGGLGYVAGLATFRALSTFAYGQNLLIREKLEWYWSFIAIIVAAIVSMIGSFKPALEAAFMFAPSEKRRIKMERKEMVRREERYLLTTAKKTMSIPGKVHESEAEIFFSYIYTRLGDLRIGEIERVEELEELQEEERPDGTRIKRFTFKYITLTSRAESVALRCELRLIREPSSEYYRAELEAAPEGEAPIRYIDYAADLVRGIIKDWERERTRLL